MRIRVPTRRIVLFIALFALALVIFLPLRLVLGTFDGAFSAREATGTAWAGSVKEARIGPATLGDLDARIAPLPLLIGRGRIEVERPIASPDRLAGALGLSSNRQSAESVTGVIPVESVFGLLPIASLELTDLTVRFRDRQCDRAVGSVRANLSGEAAGLALPTGLSGAARCDRGALLLPLTSGANGLALRIFGDGRYEAQLSTQATEPAAVARLTAAGFTSGPSGFVLTLRGRL